MYEEIVKKWETNAILDQDLVEELKKIKNDPSLLEDAFYRDLAFGTGGLRGVIGVGTNRMNVYTVIKATQGLALYLKKTYKDNLSVAISYDSRIKSTLFAKIAASTLANNNIKVHIYKELMPTPCLSYAVRYLHASAGIMITASHNPSKYNGYKVYGNDGCQITIEAANEILNFINQVDPFAIKFDSFESYYNTGMISYIEEKVYDAFIEEVKKQSLSKEKLNKDVAIVYSPLNGTGLKPVLRALNELGYTNINVVKEQENPDGNFPTCPYPNPEIKEAMALGMEYAKKLHADLLIATDPDCDRVGIAVAQKNGEYRLLSGNETGVLLLDYICATRKKNNSLKDGSTFVKTIVTTPLAEKIATHYGVKTINVLTGFKFIGEQIGLLEKKHQEDLYILGFEESYGYLTGSYVRDKDAVNGASMIVEMFTYYKNHNISLLDKLDELYKRFGYYLNTLHSYQFEGISGFKKMQNIMNDLRNKKSELFKQQITQKIDYSKGVDNLKADVLKFSLNDNITLLIRESGTEPKLKIYFFITAKDEKSSRSIENVLLEEIDKYLAKI